MGKKSTKQTDSTVIPLPRLTWAEIRKQYDACFPRAIAQTPGVATPPASDSERAGASDDKGR